MMEVAAMVQEPIQEERVQRARELASAKFRDGLDWVTFYREVLGIDGLIDQLFPEPKRAQFEKTTEYAEIQQMLAKLREKSRGQKLPDEATRVITVRLPKSLHEWLRHEAHDHKTSMNKLCISKLLQVIDGELVPSDFERSEDGDGSEKRRPARAKKESHAVADSVPSASLLAPEPADSSALYLQTTAAEPQASYSPQRPETQSASPWTSPTAPTAGAF